MVETHLYDPKYFSSFQLNFIFKIFSDFVGIKIKGTNRQRVFLIPEAADTKAKSLTVAAPAGIAIAVIQAPVPGVRGRALRRGPPVAVVANEVVSSTVVTVAARKA